MRITLRPGDVLEVGLEDTDGLFTITYGEERLTVESDLPGSHLGGAGLLYDERYGVEPGGKFISCPHPADCANGDVRCVCLLKCTDVAADDGPRVIANGGTVMDVDD